MYNLYYYFFKALEYFTKDALGPEGNFVILGVHFKVQIQFI